MAAVKRARRASRPFARLRVPEGRDAGLFWKSINRLVAVMAIANWRAAAGEVPDTAAIGRYVAIVADALRHTDAGARRYAYDVLAIREYWLPREWHDAIDDDAIYAVILDVERTRTPDDVMTPGEVGRLLRLHSVEIEAMRAGGTTVSFPPVDVSRAEHEARCLERKRAGSRERSRRYRETKKVANGRHAFPKRGGVTEGATFSSQADAVRAAVEAGAVTVGDVVAATALLVTSVKPLLSRLVKAGAILRGGRGNYAPAPPSPLAQAPEGLRDAATGTVHSGPATPPSPPERTSEVQHDAPAPAPVPDTRRALEARGTVGARRPHTLAGPDEVISLALAAPLHPRRAAPSRLPSTVFNLAAWRIHNAPSRVA